MYSGDVQSFPILVIRASLRFGCIFILPTLSFAVASYYGNPRYTDGAASTYVGGRNYRITHTIVGGSGTYA